VITLGLYAMGQSQSFRERHAEVTCPRKAGSDRRRVQRGHHAFSIVILKNSISLIVAVSTFFLSSCCVIPRVTEWEYKVVSAPNSPIGTTSPEERRSRLQSFLNDLGKDGWVRVTETESEVLFLKRPLR